MHVLSRLMRPLPRKFRILATLTCAPTGSLRPLPKNSRCRHRRCIPVQENCVRCQKIQDVGGSDACAGGTNACVGGRNALAARKFWTSAALMRVLSRPIRPPAGKFRTLSPPTRLLPGEMRPLPENSGPGRIISALRQRRWILRAENSGRCRRRRLPWRLPRVLCRPDCVSCRPGSGSVRPNQDAGGGFSPGGEVTAGGSLETWC
jgi:hypothetical protein